MIPPLLPPAELLRQLKTRIESEIENFWLYPARRAVKGFFGTAPITIVGWRPSWSSFPDEGANKLYYDILTGCGLENAHLTNFVKSRGRKDDPDPTDMRLHEEIFLRELEIVSGYRAVVPMGPAYEKVSGLLSAHGIRPIYRLRQYASMNYGADKVEEFRHETNELSAIARREGWIT